jgi:hypothetical protein
VNRKEALLRRTTSGADEVERYPAPAVAVRDREALWMDERSRQQLLESFGQLTISELLDGSV